MVESPLDTRVPHVARMYNYWLGGKGSFAADRAAAPGVGRRRAQAGESATMSAPESLP